MMTRTGVPSRGRSGRGLALGAAGLLILLNACAELDPTAGSGDQASAAPEAGQASRDPQPAEQAPRSDGNIDPKMEPAPESFQTKDFAVWNEAKTLPGIWIAHPEADVARRVRVTNDETGAQVDAAMFRRDPSLSGPRIILSSEIAEWLDLTPGHATPVTIEALTYRIPVEPEPASLTEPADAEPAQADATADMAEPDSAADAGAPETPLAEPSEEDAEGEAQDPVAEAASPAAEPIEAAPVEASAVEPPAVEAEAEETGEPAPALPPAAEPLVENVAPEDDTAALDEPENVGVPNAATAPASDPDPNETTDQVVGPAPLLTNPPAEEPASGTGSDIADGRNFVQAGLFGEAANAARLAEKLRAAGLSAVERPLTLGKRQFTRVLVGPYDTIAERDAALRTVREIGPADATPAKG